MSNLFNYNSFIGIYYVILSLDNGFIFLLILYPFIFIVIKKEHKKNKRCWNFIDKIIKIRYYDKYAKEFYNEYDKHC